MELEKLKSLYQQLAATYDEPLFLDKNGTILNWTEEAYTIYGYSAGEIIGQHFMLFYLPKDRQARVPEKNLVKVTREGSVSHEGLRIRNNGTLFRCSVTMSAIYDSDNKLAGFAKSVKKSGV